MRAAIMTAHGGPEVLEVRDDAPTPQPGPGQVRVRVAAAGVNTTDVWTREGAYGTAEDPDAVAGWLGVPIDVPRIQGGDAAGTVDAVGAGVDPGLVGTRVLVDPATYDADDEDGLVVAVMGSEHDGAFAEHLVVDADRVHDVGDSPLSDVELAALPIAYGTAMGMLARAGVAAGDRVVVTGASGGVGIAAVQLARSLGADVTGVTTAAHADAVVDAGADRTVDRTAGDPPAQLRDLGRTADVVVDVVGGHDFGAWLGVLAPRGRIVVAGAVAGPVVELDLRQLYLQRRRIIGSTMHARPHLDRLVGLARDGAFRPPVAATFPLDRIHDAQQALTGGGAVGKVVLDLTARP